ncbi:MAG: hypothetical protein WCC60_18130, partial [Ilumatobacteraceae bacterium]
MPGDDAFDQLRAELAVCGFVGIDYEFSRHSFGDEFVDAVGAAIEVRVVRDRGVLTVLARRRVNGKRNRLIGDWIAVENLAPSADLMESPGRRSAV